jgi:hypothetical protein
MGGGDGVIYGSEVPRFIIVSLFVFLDVFSEVLLIMIANEIDQGLEELHHKPSELDFSRVSHDLSLQSFDF